MVPTYNNSDHITVSLDGVLKISPGVDSLCYNYTLDTVFRNRPGIAICKYKNNFSRI